MVTTKRLDLDKFQQKMLEQAKAYSDKWEDARNNGDFEVSYFYAAISTALYKTQIAFQESIIHENLTGK